MNKKNYRPLLLLALLLVSPLCLAAKPADKPATPATTTTNVVPTYAEVVFINYANGYSFMGVVLVDGTECVIIERDAGTLAAWRDTECNFTGKSWFKRTAPPR